MWRSSGSVVYQFGHFVMTGAVLHFVLVIRRDKTETLPIIGYDINKRKIFTNNCHKIHKKENYKTGYATTLRMCLHNLCLKKGQI